LDALNRIVDTVVIASKFNIKLSYEVFIHKVDGLSDDLKIGKTLHLLIIEYFKQTKKKKKKKKKKKNIYIYIYI